MNGEKHAHMHKNAYAVTFIHKEHQEYLTLPSSTQRVHPNYIQITERAHSINFFSLGSGNGRHPSFVLKGLVSRRAFRRTSISPLDGAMLEWKIDPLICTS